jgi:hypothetical protein
MCTRDVDAMHTERTEPVAFPKATGFCDWTEASDAQEVQERHGSDNPAL